MTCQQHLTIIGKTSSQVKHNLGPPLRLLKYNRQEVGQRLGKAHKVEVGNREGALEGEERLLLAIRPLQKPSVDMVRR